MLNLGLLLAFSHDDDNFDQGDKMSHKLGDLWFGEDRRPYTCANIKNTRTGQSRLVNLMISTAAEHSTINTKILDKIGLLATDHPILEVHFKELQNCPITLGPAADEHRNTEDGVLGHDIMRQTKGIWDFNYGNMSISVT